VKKHLNETLLAKWNSLASRSIILVAKRGVNTDVFSLPLEFSDLSLNSLKLGTKNIKKKFIPKLNCKNIEGSNRYNLKSWRTKLNSL
jgi:hypothetical protein